LHRKLQYIDKR